MSPLLRVENLSIHFPHQCHAIRNLSFILTKGSFSTLVGESGSGKSITAKAIMRLFTKNQASIEGKIFLQDIDLLSLSEKQMRRIRGHKIGMIFQDPSASLNPTMPIGKQVEESCRKANPKSSKKEIKERSLYWLEQVGLSDAHRCYSFYPFQLSGGMKQRVMIASVLAAHPTLLIADEPTTALDAILQEQILDMIAKLTKHCNITLLLITHNLPLVRRFADHVFVMHRGEIVERSSPHQLFSHPQHSYTKHLLNPILSSHSSYTDYSSSCILHLSSVKKIFSSAHKPIVALDDIHLQVYSQEVVGIIGESGSGKSTLAKLLMGLEKPTAGSILFQGQQINALSREQLLIKQKQMQIVFQDSQGSLNPKKTIQQILQEPFLIHKAPFSIDIISHLLSLVLLPSTVLSRYSHELSGGQRQRVVLARALALQPSFLVCDEPTSALDQSTLSQILSLLQDLQKQLSLTMIFITHDLDCIRRITNRVYVMYRGRIIEEGATSRILSHPIHPYTKTLLSSSYLQKKT